MPTSTPHSARSQTPTASFMQRLDEEWSELHRARRALRTARTWGRGAPDHPLSRLVAGIDDLDAIVAATQRGQSHDDAILARLIELSHDDDLAGRVVLQRLLPGLVARSIRYRDYHGRSDPLEIAVPATWIALQQYDTERRARNIAATVISDAVFQAFRRPLRRRAAAEVTRDTSIFATTPAEHVPDALEELAAVIREAAASGVSTDDIDLVRDLVRAGSPRALAAQRRVTPRTIRNHRARAIRQIRAAVAVAA